MYIFSSVYISVCGSIQTDRLSLRTLLHVPVHRNPLYSKISKWLLQLAACRVSDQNSVRPLDEQGAALYMGRGSSG